MIDFGQVGHAEAFERLAAVLRVVEDDVDDRAAERHALAEVVDEGASRRCSSRTRRARVVKAA